MTQELSGYSAIARLFHWSIAVLVLLMIPAGLVMVTEGLPRAVQNTLFIFHKNTGLVILFLVLLRFLYRKVNPPPSLPESLPGWQKTAAILNHGILYVLLFLMPIAGYVRVKAGDFPIEALDALGVPSLVPKSESLANFASLVHATGAFLLIAFVSLHLLAAAYHGLVRRDGVVARMARGRSGSA